MRSTLLSVYVITEAKNIFLKFINKLKCYFNLNIFLLLLKVDDISQISHIKQKVLSFQ